MGKKEKIISAIILVLFVAIIVVLAVGLSGLGKSEPLPAAQGGAGQASETPRTPRLIEIEKEVTAEIIQDGLTDMGFLVTQEYDCTGVVGASKVKTIFNIEIPFTESSYLISYDATVEAGIDFTKVTVDKDDSAKVITVHMPDAEIKSVTIDHESFTLYSEKDGLGTKMTVKDFNDSLVEYEATVRKKAVDRGVLENAAENARLVVGNFVRSLVDTTEYMINVE